MSAPARIKFAEPIPYTLTEAPKGIPMNEPAPKTVSHVERSYLLTMRQLAKELRQLEANGQVKSDRAALAELAALAERWVQVVTSAAVDSGPAMLAMPSSEATPNIPLDVVGVKLDELGREAVISFRTAVWDDGDAVDYVCTIARVLGSGHTAQVVNSALAVGSTPSVAYECALREWATATANAEKPKGNGA